MTRRRNNPRVVLPREDAMRQAGESPATNLPRAGRGPKDDAARANAAGGRRRPAARDGGDAAPVGMAGELRGAAGPARLVVVESPYAGNVDLNLRYTQPGVLRDDVPEERAKGIAAGFAIGALFPRRVFYVDLGFSRGMDAGYHEAPRLGQAISIRRLGGEWAHHELARRTTGRRTVRG